MDCTWAASTSYCSRCCRHLASPPGWLLASGLRETSASGCTRLLLSLGGLTNTDAARLDSEFVREHVLTCHILSPWPRPLRVGLPVGPCFVHPQGALWGAAHRYGGARSPWPFPCACALNLQGAHSSRTPCSFHFFKVSCCKISDSA